MLMDFLNFTFTNFWYFLGVFLLLATALSGTASIIRAFFNHTEINVNTKEGENDDE